MPALDDLGREVQELKMRLLRFSHGQDRPVRGYLGHAMGHLLSVQRWLDKASQVTETSTSAQPPKRQPAID